MRKNIHTSLIIIHTVLLFCILSGSNFASAGRAVETYSFRFENCTISEALREISQKSGVTILLKSDINKTIQGKSYTNRTLDRIIADLFRGENCAVVWNYNKGILASIGLYAFDKDSKTVNMRFIPEMTPPVREAEIEKNNEVIPAIQDSESVRADEESEMETRRALMAREMMRRRDAENNNSPPERRFQGISRSRRVNEAGEAVSSSSADDSGAVDPSTEVTTGAGAITVEEVNAETSPIVPDETIMPPSPETPDPASFNGLEPPPMPPGL
jgi:hypothetical protein